jgi:hypothetical protein
MRFRILSGFYVALFMLAACGSTELGPGGDGGSGNDDDDGGSDFGWGSGEGGSSTGIFDGGDFDDGGTVFADASVDADGGRRHRDGGIGGGDGGFFFDGGFGFDGGITVEDAGITPPPPPPPDDGGSVGPRDAGTLSGPLLRDANGVVLGEIVSIQSEGAIYTIITSTDYLVDINFDGTFPQQAFLYSGTSCSGTPYLEGGSVSRELLGNTVVYSSSQGTLLIPAGPLTSGAASSVPVNWSSVSDPCENSAGTGFYGWPLVATTAANVGLPATIAAPLSYP